MGKQIQKTVKYCNERTNVQAKTQINLLLFIRVATEYWNAIKISQVFMQKLTTIGDKIISNVITKIETAKTWPSRVSEYQTKIISEQSLYWFTFHYIPQC